MKLLNLSLLILFPIAWFAPLMRAGLLPFFSLNEISIITGIVDLWGKDVFLALLVTYGGCVFNRHLYRGGQRRGCGAFGNRLGVVFIHFLRAFILCNDTASKTHCMKGLLNASRPVKPVINGEIDDNIFLHEMRCHP